MPRYQVSESQHILFCEYFEFKPVDERYYKLPEAHPSTETEANNFRDFLLECILCCDPFGDKKLVDCKSQVVYTLFFTLMQ